MHESLKKSSIVIPGSQLITSDALRGYGTYQNNSDHIYSARCGIIEKVDQIVSVRGFQRSYCPEVSDVLIARVVEISGSRWKCHIGSTQLATLLLSNTANPGGVQKRKDKEDELTMRMLFTEGDLLIAEVQRLQNEGVSLQIRNKNKFGRIDKPGQLIIVSHYLIEKLKTHFHTFKRIGVSLVLGMNGWVWICPSEYTQHWIFTTSIDESNDDIISNTISIKDARINVARMANCIKLLNTFGLSIHPKILELSFKLTIDNSIIPTEILPGTLSESLIRSVVNQFKNNSLENIKYE